MSDEYRTYYSYPNRTLCAILGDMRNCFKTYHFAPMAGLIEELQSRANRMEAALEDKHDYKEILEKKSEAKDELRKLEAEIKAKQKELKDLEKVETK